MLIFQVFHPFYSHRSRKFYQFLTTTSQLFNNFNASDDLIFDPLQIFHIKSTAFFIILLLLVNSKLHAQKNDDTFCSQFMVFWETLTVNHYAPVGADATVSEQIFSDFIDFLDPDRAFFTVEDSIALYNDPLRLGKVLASDQCSFMANAIAVYRKSLLRADSIITFIGQNPFDFQKKESIVLDGGQRFTSGGPSKSNDVWRKILKYGILESLFDRLAEDSTQSEYPLIITPELEKTLRSKVAQKNKKRIQRILDHPIGFENYVRYLFYNAVGARFDPHTAFFDTKSMELFMESNAAEQYAYGFNLKEEKVGGIKINQLIPGGPAWKSGMINEGDQLLKDRSEQ